MEWNGVRATVRDRERWEVLCKPPTDTLQAWSGPEGSRKLRFPDFMTTA